MFLHFINRVLNPIVELKSESEVNLFLDMEQEWIENTDFYKNKYEKLGEKYQVLTKHTRVIAFFHDKKEYSNELKLFKKAAQALVGRDDLRIGLVTKPELVKSIKTTYKVKFFDEYSLNSIVLEREKDTFFYYDVEQSSEDMGYWMNKMSLNKLGEEYTRESYYIG